ncbi:MAG TPA: hypothetical protein VGG57_13800 [Stellaceae bacterium]
MAPRHLPSLVEASLASATSISQTMTGVIQPQIDTHSAQIGAAQGLIGTQGEAMASARVLIDGHTVSITAAEKAISTQGEAMASAKAQIDGHTVLITAADKKIDSQGEAIAGANARIHAHHERLTGMQADITALGETTSRIDHAISFALVGEEAQIQQLIRRVEWLEHNCSPREGSSGGSGSEQSREMREASDALHERVTSMEETIRQLLARGPEGGAPRRPR